MQFKLQRSFQPYIGLTVMMVALTIFLLWPVNKASESGSYLSLLLVWFFFALYVVMSLTYRISLEGTTIVQRGFGMKAISIPINLIRSIKLEAAILATRGRFGLVNRPFRRLVVTPTDDAEKYIDISLKHFNADSIRELMGKVQELRPELSCPKQWLPEVRKAGA